MKKKVKFILLYCLALPLSISIVAYALFLTFQFTLVAEIRESFTGVNEQDPLAYGKVLFESRSCSGCHPTIPGQKSLGPNLFGISQKASEDYIRQSIVSPDAVISPGYSADIMPNYGEILDADQIEALVTYLLTVK